MDEGANKTLSAISLVWALCNAIGVLAVAVMFSRVRITFSEMFEELGVQLPLLTRLFIAGKGLYWCAAGVAALAALFAKELIGRNAVKVVLNGAFSIIIMAFWSLFTTSVMLPLFQILDQLSGH